jgi:hypothetical protein
VKLKRGPEINIYGGPDSIEVPKWQFQKLDSPGVIEWAKLNRATRSKNAI